MVIYTCNDCNFSTNKTTNYHRHLQTNKHIKNIDKNMKKQDENENNHVNHKNIVYQLSLNDISCL